MKLKEILQIEENKFKQNCELIKHDYQAGLNDCTNGIYDKWYRYNRKDHGYIYDMGWMETNFIVKNDNVEFINEPCIL